MRKGMPQRHAALLGATLLVMGLVAACSDCANCGLPPPPPLPDLTGPKVASLAPACRSTTQAVDAPIAITFDEPMDPTTLGAAIQVTGPDGAAVAGNVGFSGQTATFTPTAALAPATAFRVTVSAAAHDTSGNDLSPVFGCSFTTAGPADNAAPAISAVNPACDSTGVGTNRRIAVSFSEPMLSGSLTNATVSLAEVVSGTAVAGSVTASGATAVFRPTATLDPSTQHRLTVTTGATDAAGNPLPADFTCLFTTGTGTEATAPLVSSVAPACGATAVPVNDEIVVGFSEGMLPDTLNGTTLTLSTPAGAVAGTVSYTGNSARFTPTTDLAGGTVHTVAVTTGAQDLAGNAAVAFSCAFTTGTAADLVRPTVAARAPACGALTVAPNSRLAFAFSEAMNPASLSTATITVTGPLGAVAGAVRCVDCGNATFAPAADLAPGDQSVSVLGAVRDLAGNTLGASSTCTVTVAGANDVAPPTLTAVNPAANDTNVCRTPTVTATFSEDMDPATLTAASFQLRLASNLSLVPATVTYDLAARTARLRPVSPLTASVGFSASVSTDAQDLAGNGASAVGLPLTWTFTTGATTCP
ncbi:MAG TPA: Ig-like domain-containing protein [Solimonas sp.]|nr:Ig-like domain-containing protein [Solimonas sp.]